MFQDNERFDLPQQKESIISPIEETNESTLLNPHALQTLALTAVALTAFAANSLLCRMSLGSAMIDSISFTAIRIASGAVALMLLTAWGAADNRSTANTATPANTSTEANWWPSILLFAYALTFSLAYVSLSTGVGALFLFGSVQATMLVYAMIAGERLSVKQWLGFTMAVIGLLVLLLPGSDTPNLVSAAAMCISGVAWGLYSIAGRNVASPARQTRTNFQRALLPALACSLLAVSAMKLTPIGVLYACVSGAVASGLGYVVWYRAVARLSSSQAAFVQLLVPVLAAIAGVVVLSERVSVNLVIASLLILTGVAVATKRKPPET